MEKHELESGVWVEAFRVHSYEVDLKREATLEVICRYLQEAAWNHSEKLGVGYKHLEAQGKLWVLSRLLVRVGRLPQWGETVLVKTWPRAARSVFAMRDFDLCSSAGGTLLCATSAWLVLDAEKRRPQRVDKLTPSLKALSERRATECDPEKLPPCISNSEPAVLAARYSDIDVNGHVNNTRYLGWILDTYPAEFHKTHAIRQAELNFLGETTAGEQIALSTQPSAPSVFSHSVRKSGQGGEVCRARLSWGLRGAELC